MNQLIKIRFLFRCLLNLWCALFALTCLFIMPGCGSSSGNAAETTPDLPLPPVDVQDISIEMAPAVWDQIRHTARDPEILIPICGDDAAVSPYEYVSATVTVEGETFSDVGVRTKGWWGSVNPTRPSIKIKFDEFVDGQNWQGIERMTLNNNNHDPSRMHTCLAFKTFRRAGYPAPQCRYARVVVNGKDMGVYSSVEPIKDPFLEDWFGSDEGNLYESQICDFVPDSIHRFERKNNDATAGDRSDIEAVMTALEADDATLLDELEPLVDLDMFYTYWALEVLISFWDGYNGNNNNYYIYNNPDTGKFVFIPWGPDDSFKSKSDFLSIDSVGPLFANSTLSKRLYDHPVGRARFIAEFDRLYQLVWGTDRLAREVRHTRKALQPYISDEFNPDFQDGVTGLLGFLSLHPTNLKTTLLDAAPPAYPYEPYYRCYARMPETYDFRIVFATTWGPSEFKGGTVSTFDVSDDEGPNYFFPVFPGLEDYFYSATAAPTVVSDTGGPGNVKLSFMEIYFTPEDYRPRGDLAGIILNLPPEKFLSGEPVILDNLTTTGMVFYLSDYSGGAQPTFTGIMTDGTISFSEAGMNVGDPVSGTFEGELVFY